MWRTRAAVLALATACAIAACATASMVYRGPRSGHFDGTHFQNEEPFDPQPPGWVARWLLTRRRAAWPDVVLPSAPPPPRRVGGRELRVTFVNHATVLIQIDSLNILTDPVWSDRIGPEDALGTPRHRTVGVRVDDLPPIDVVLLSHDHYDHMDLPTLRPLQAEFHPRIVTGLGNAGYLSTYGIEHVDEIDWWRSDTIAPGVRVTGVPAQHWSGRTLTDHDERLWMGFVIEAPHDTIYFAGDTGWGRFFYELRARWDRFRLAFLPIAPFEPRWYMSRKHESPSDAVRAAETIRAATSIPIHWGTFELGDDGPLEGVDSLRAALATLAPRCRPPFVVLDNGESALVPPIADGALTARDDPACELSRERFPPPRSR